MPFGCFFSILFVPNQSHSYEGKHLNELRAYLSIKFQVMYDKFYAKAPLMMWRRYDDNCKTTTIRLSWLSISRYTIISIYCPSLLQTLTHAPIPLYPHSLCCRTCTHTPVPSSPLHTLTHAPIPLIIIIIIIIIIIFHTIPRNQHTFEVITILTSSKQYSNVCTIVRKCPAEGASVHPQ